MSDCYRTIVADPPWHYDNHATMPGNANKRGHVVKREQLPYESLSVEEISALPIRTLSTPPEGCNLFLWATNRYLPAALEVLNAWGFTYRQTLVWHKTGNPSPFGGTAAPNHAEYLLLGQWGPAKMLGRLESSVVAAPKPYEHSRKPDLFLDLIEQISPEPRVELFARRARFGWDYWGDESLQTVEMPAA